MDSPSTTAESKHTYQPTSWGRLSTASTPRSNSTSLPESPPIPFPIPADLLALLTPQTSSYQAQVQAQLLQYNKLISPGRGGGGGLQGQPPLPPVSSPHSQAPPPRSRSSSKVSNKDNQQPKQPGAQSGHGNRARKNSDKPDRAVITGRDTPPKMPPKQADLSHTLPARPAQRAAQVANPPAHSSSVPSTPHQHARNFSFESREPSPNAGQNHSPRSAYSETNGNVPSLRPLPPRFGGCIYETAFVPGRRRMPYSIGSDRLESVDPDKIKSKLSEDEERKLTTDMRELYDRLLPTSEVEKNRQKLVQKLERIFNEEWSGHDIRVHLFGSSGNLLCSDDSDVDICITTEWKEMEGVCMIADLLKKRGMEKVVCVSSAKVPIVKIWDPELGLACDMNVNNTLALENTRMVRTYVEIDPRVRPLAMIIKYWTRRRIVNDAAFGGTLSSYTWICMIIIFLQLRTPPVVPALHQRPHQKLPTKDGHKTEFADDLSKLRGFGDKNKSSLGELLFQFFRFYAHEFDYDKMALSVRLGKMITKTEKKWHLAQNNMLCVEEPFNTARNLGNTADDTSFRGLHIELRRAFDLIAEGKLDECCEQYVFPKEEEKDTQRVWQKPAPRPAILRSSSQQHSGRGGRGGNYRGNRHFSRNGNGNRRSSSSQTFESNPVFVPTGLPPTLTPQEMQWYQSQPAQYFQSDVFGTLNALQMQEHSLRFQLYTHQQFAAQQQALAHAQRMQGTPSQSSDRSRTNSFDQPPLTAPIRPEMYMYGLPLQPSPFYPQTGFTTYPSSPATASAAPEFRRSLHRTTVTSDSGNSSGSGSLRSQSQPASRSSLPSGQAIPGYPGSTQPLNAIPTFPPRHVNGVSMPSFTPDENVDVEADNGPTKVASITPPEEENSRYIGYYVNDSSSPVRKLNGVANGIPTFGDLAQSSQARRRLSTDQLPQSILDRRMRRTSRSPSPLGHARAFSMGTNSAPLVSAPFQQTTSRLSQENRPLVVNGSAFTPSSTATSSLNPSTSEGRTPDESGYDNPLHINQGQVVSSFVQEPLPITQNSAPLEPIHTFAERPVVVNGSNHSPAAQSIPDAQSFGQRIAAMGIMNSVPYASVVGEVPNGRVQNRQRVMSRQQQNVIAPLDLAIGDHSVMQDLQHLSPVYETRTPSPTVVRRFETSSTHEKPVLPPSTSGLKESRPDPQKPSQRSAVESGSVPVKKETVSGNLQHPRINGIARENGHTRAAKSESDNPSGWQKPKSRKKQADLKNAANGYPQSEQLPKNEADRKGG